MASKEEQQKVFKVCLAQEKVEFQEALTKAVSVQAYYTIENIFEHLILYLYPPLHN